MFRLIDLLIIMTVCVIFGYCGGKEHGFTKLLKFFGLDDQGRVKMLKSKKLIKVVGVVSVALLSFGSGYLASKGTQRTQASRTRAEKIKLGTRYHYKGLTFKVSSYKCKGKDNFVITTNLKHKQFYQVGSNDDKQGRTSGVTVAFGSDQR